MKTIIAILTIIGFAFGAYFYIDTRYALSEDVKKVEKKVDYEILSNQIDKTQERIWKIEDRYRGKQMEQTVEEEFKGLQKRKEELDRKIKALEK